MARRVTTKQDISAVVSLYKGGKKTPEIVEITQLHERTVQRLIAKFQENGENYDPVPKPRSGRPRLVSKRSLGVVRRQVEANPRLTARELKESNPNILGGVSIRCVQKILHDDLGYRSCRPRRKPLVTAAQKHKRLQFCKKYGVWNEEDWEKVLWSDEAMFTVTGSGHTRLPQKILEC